MRRLPRPLTILLAGTFLGALGAVVLSALGGVVAGKGSCSVYFSVDSTASLVGAAMSIGAFGGIVGLFFGFAIAAGGAFWGRRNLMALEIGVIGAVVGAGDGLLGLLGSVSFNSAFDHERCISASLMGGFVGASLGVLIGIYLASKALSTRLLLGSFAVVGAITVPIGLLLWKLIGWAP